MKLLKPRLPPRLPLRRNRTVERREQNPQRSRVREVARRWNWALWLAGVVVCIVGLCPRSSYLAVLVLGVGIAVVVALWWLPKLQAAHSQGTSTKNQFDRENEARKTLAQIVGGVLLLVGLYSSIKTLDLQRASSSLQRETENLQREGQITDRFTKAINQLGASSSSTKTDYCGREQVNLPIRLGGIYALERIGHDSPKDHWAIIQVLTAYVRENASANLDIGVTSKESKHTSKDSTPVCRQIRPDIQAILNVIGNSDMDYEPNDHRLDLSGANLENANFENVNLRGANLSGTDLLGAVNLEEGQLAETIGDVKTKLPPPLLVDPKKYVVWYREASAR